MLYVVNMWPHTLDTKRGQRRGQEEPKLHGDIFVLAQVETQLRPKHEGLGKVEPFLALPALLYLCLLSLRHRPLPGDLSI